MGVMEGGSHTEDARTASTGSVGRFESADSAHAFDLDLGPLTSQPQGPHAVRIPLACQDVDHGSSEDRRMLPESQGASTSSELLAQLDGRFQRHVTLHQSMYWELVGHQMQNVRCLSCSLHQGSGPCSNPLSMATRPSRGACSCMETVRLICIEQRNIMCVRRPDMPFQLLREQCARIPPARPTASFPIEVKTLS